MKHATAILVLTLAVGTAWAQNPDVIENTRNTLHAVQVKQTNDSNAALAASQGQATSAQQPAASAKPSPAAANAPSHPANASPTQAAKAKPVTVAKPVAAKATASPGTATAPTAVAKTAVAKSAAPVKAKTKTRKAKTTAIAVEKPQTAVAVEDKKTPEDPKKPKVINFAAGRRDPFISPVVSRSMVGSGCSTGKRCLAIDQIALKGVVKSDSGMIAVVVNALDKAYFLRENDPVFNGYVVKITGDSIVFKETVQDKLGKPFTRDVTKKIMTPAV